MRCQNRCQNRVANYYHYDRGQLDFYKKIHIKTQSKKKDVLLIFTLQETNEFQFIWQKLLSRERLIRHTGIPGLWTLDSGHQTLNAGLWTPDSGHWTLDAGLWMPDARLLTLDSRRLMLHFGHWPLGTGHYLLEQNMKPVSDSAWLNYWKSFRCEFLRTSWSPLLYRL